jgi:hypothetical protein
VTRRSYRSGRHEEVANGGLGSHPLPNETGAASFRNCGMGLDSTKRFPQIGGIPLRGILE